MASATVSRRSGRATPNEALLLRLAGTAAAAEHAFAAASGAAAVRGATFAEAARGGIPRGVELGVSGAPPEHEIGYGLTPLLALRARANAVTLIDTCARRTRRRSLGSYAASAAPFAAGQLLVSGAALLLQQLLVAAGPLVRPVNERPTTTLRRALYLRPLVGTGSPVGGSVTHTHGVLRGLRQAGVAVRAVTSDATIAATAAAEDDPPCSWRVVEAPRLTKAVPASATLGADAALIAAGLDASLAGDLVYQRHARFSLAGMMLSQLARRPLFLEYNGPELFFSRHWQPMALEGHLVRLEDVALRGATRVVVVSDALRTSLVERGVDDGRIIVNPNGVDADRFAQGGGASLRARLGVGERDFVVGFVGSFSVWHGAPVLARAFVDIAAALPGARLLLVGDGPERAAAQGILTEAGLSQRVTWGGTVAPGAVAAYLDACDVLASPTMPLPGGQEFFGSPTKLFEYMAAGKAIVASRLGQLAHVLDDAETGLLVRAGDPRALANAVLRVAGSPDLRDRLGANARQRAVERHSWRRNAERLVQAYEQLPPAARALP